VHYLNRILVVIGHIVTVTRYGIIVVGLIFFLRQKLLEKSLVLAPELIHALGDQLDALLLHAVVSNGVEAIGLPLFKVLGAENGVFDEIINGEDQAEIALLGVQVPYPLQLFERLG